MLFFHRVLYGETPFNFCDGCRSRTCDVPRGEMIAQREQFRIRRRICSKMHGLLRKVHI
jgi:hypothetical protein